MSKSVSIIGAPFALGQPKGGVEDGPKAMRDAGLLHDIKALGLEVTDLGDMNSIQTRRQLRMSFQKMSFRYRQ